MNQNTSSRIDSEAPVSTAVAARGAPLDSTARDQIQGGDAFGEAGAIVVSRRHQRDAASRMDALVCCEHAARRTSGRGECQYSSRR
jgi:hypothetical protein